MRPMKKCIALLLVVLMAFSVAGCAESLKQIQIPPLPQVTPTPAPASATLEPTPAQTEQTAAPQPTENGEPTEAPIPEEETMPRILVSIGNTTKLDYDQNEEDEQDELILTFSYDMPRLYSEDFPESVSRINEALATEEERFYTGDSYDGEGRHLGYSAMLEAAEDNYSYVLESGVTGIPLELSDTLSTKVMRCDETLLSVLYIENCYTGGAHGSSLRYGMTFDMQTGEELKLQDLSQDYPALEEMLVQTMLQMAEEDEDGYFSERIEESFLPAGGREEAFRNLLRDDSWYFDLEGIVFVSNLYELGPYAAGIVEFHIPYEKLQGYLDDRFLYPPERSGKGKVTVDLLSELDGGELEIVDRVIVHEDGEDLCFVVEGEIYDVSIATVYYSDRFYENTQLWWANVLSDCALQLKVVVPEGLPDLRITYYTADGERHGMLLSQSGVDGSYILVGDDIEAVG